MMPLALFLIFFGAVVMDTGDGMVTDTSEDEVDDPNLDEEDDGEDADPDDDLGDDETPDLDDQPTEDDPADDTPVEDDPADDTPTEDDPADDTPVEDDPVDDTPEDTNPFTVETDRFTGAVTVTAADDAGGSFALIQGVDPFLVGVDVGDQLEILDYSSVLVFVPDGVDLEALYNAYAFEGGEPPRGDDGPTLATFFAELGVQPVAEFDQGGVYLDPLAAGRDSDGRGEFDTRTNLPDISSTDDLPIAYYQTTATVNIDNYGHWGGSSLDAVDSADDLAFDWVTTVASVEAGEPAPPIGDTDLSELVVQDGDVIQGGSGFDTIYSPGADDTAVTIRGGAGEDEIWAGLNDTIITDDDDDADTIKVDSPNIFGETYDDVPVIQAGAEDTVEVGGDNNFAIRYVAGQADGSVQVFYHIVTADAPLSSPAPVLDDQSGSISIEQLYQDMGWQLVATGNLGSLDPAPTPGLGLVDNTLAAPTINGLDEGLFTVDVATDGLVEASASTFEPGWSGLVFV